MLNIASTSRQTQNSGTTILSQLKKLIANLKGIEENDIVEKPKEDYY